ncbi:CBM35 domain-containing protein [Streptomyces chengbuensis]|uniref:CBM35 domain-containing protein n=1 Tax=Streptomyces TaxID=1883 RepID=UPI0025B4749E|nr:CBM35 domain-containing protein [Streptomyces sp. HUAS CB01]WJY51165.1 CBM35 domain-containing protein [Streptomyces sp. HUAS CB01]
MTAGNNGASKPEDDDPFGYLYADGQQAGGTSTPRQGGYGYPGPAAQPGVPRTSYNQVRTVGERQYGQQPQAGQQYGQVPHQAQYGQQPSPQYAAPETYPGGAPTRQVPMPPGGGSGRGRGPNTRGLLIGAVAVVAVVVIGITAAVMTSGDDKTENPQAGQNNTAPADEAGPSDDPAKDDEEKPVELPKQDAATLRLGPPAVLAKDIKGAEGADGAYVTGFNAVGASVTWNANIDQEGQYRLYVRYAIPAKDADATLSVNGKANSNPIGLKNFIGSKDPNWEKNWQTTWAPVNLKKGQNEIKLSCEQGNQCDAILDYLEVRTGAPN